MITSFMVMQRRLLSMLHGISYCRWKLVHQTKPSKESPNVKWETITISVRTLCNGDYDR